MWLQETGNDAHWQFESFSYSGWGILLNSLKNWCAGGFKLGAVMHFHDKHPSHAVYLTVTAAHWATSLPLSLIHGHSLLGSISPRPSSSHKHLRRLVVTSPRPALNTLVCGLQTNYLDADKFQFQVVTQQLYQKLWSLLQVPTENSRFAEMKFLYFKF